MASGKQGILGALSGRVANVVCSSWKGIAVFKSLPASVANPRTNAQLQQRGRMSNIVMLASQINTPFIKPLWDRFQVEKSGYNAFVQANIANADEFGGTAPSMMVMSKGKMPETSILSATAIIGLGQLAVTWYPGFSDQFSQGSDKPYLVAVNKTRETSFAIAPERERNDGSASISLPSGTDAGDVLSVYLAFRRADGTVVSNSSYSDVTYS